MKKIFLIVFTIFLSNTFMNANNTNKTDDELIAEFMQLEKQLKEEKIKTKVLKEKTVEIKKLSKTVDELAKSLGVEN